MARPKHQSGVLPVLVLDLLETHFGSWFSLPTLHQEVCRFKPEAKYESVRMAVRRLADDNMIERRYVEGANRGPRGLQMQVRSPFRSYLELTG